MKIRYFLLAALGVLLGTLTPQKAQADDVKMPVLRVIIPDEILPNMAYSNGSATLTDENDSVSTFYAKFRTRGATALSYDMKPALNMKIRTADYSTSEDMSLLGMPEASSWILDAMAIDRICMRNRLITDVWNEMYRLPYETDFDGRNGTVGRFVEVYINGNYRGIYCLTTKINRKLLQLKKYDEEKQRVRGVLYKCGTTDVHQQNEREWSADSTVVVVDYHNAWELKEPEDKGGMEAFKPLLDFYEARQSYDTVMRYFYPENLVDYQLLITAFSVMDNWGYKNFFFSIRNIRKDIADPDTTEANRRKFIITPWDLDTGLGGYYDGSMYDGNYAEWPVEIVAKNANAYPFSAIQSIGNYDERLKSRWKQLRLGPLSRTAVFARLEAYRDLFVNSGAWARQKARWDAVSARPLYVDDLTKEIDYIKAWYDARVTEMDAYYGITSPKGDANGDGTVSVADANIVINYLNGAREDDINLSAADADGDGNVTSADVDAILKTYLSK